MIRRFAKISAQVDAPDSIVKRALRLPKSAHLFWLEPLGSQTGAGDLATYADRAGWIWVRQETIAVDLERSRAWVHAAVSELEGQGLEGRQRASRYRLLDGLARRADNAADPVSEETDAAVQPADTNQHDESKDSLPHPVRGARDETGQGIKGDPPEPCPASPPAPAPPNGIAPDWVPSAADVAWAEARYPNLDVLAFTETFVLSCRAKGYGIPTRQLPGAAG